jgi:UDP-N-acetylmuramyl pentapeptide phosphotransferase/UDP-N-acetylglucosamine-1-phosphate transferase
MILSLLISFSLTLIIILLSARWVVNSGDMIDVQKFHSSPVSRIAGISIFVSFLGFEVVDAYLSSVRIS